MKRINLFLGILILLSSCSKNDNVDYPIILEDSVGYETYPGNKKQLDIDGDSNFDIEIVAEFYGSIGGASFTVKMEVVNSSWNVKTTEKIHYICQDTIGLGSPEFECYKQYSCDEVDNFVDSETYEAIKIFEEESLSEINACQSKNGKFLLHEKNSVGAYGCEPGSVFIDFIRSDFGSQNKGFIVLEKENGQLLKLVVEILESNYGIFLDQIDEIN